MSNIIKNWEIVQERIENAAFRSGRKSSEIKIIAVSKTKSAENIKEAVQAGVTILGENRVQEAWQKFQELGEIASWHLVGHLQRNKVKRALQMFDVLHSVDSTRLAEEINRRCEQLNRTVEVLMEVKTSDEPAKFGINPKDAHELAEKISTLPNLKLIGLMTLGKWTSNETEVRNCFKLLVKVKEEIEKTNISKINLKHLSMGMSGDFEWAIEEGATMVRIGTAIFGARNY